MEIVQKPTASGELLLYLAKRKKSGFIVTSVVQLNSLHKSSITDFVSIIKILITPFTK